MTASQHTRRGLCAAGHSRRAGAHVDMLLAGRPGSCGPGRRPGPAAWTGDPGSGSRAWRFGGHHLSLSYTITGGALASATPSSLPCYWRRTRRRTSSPATGRYSKTGCGPRGHPSCSVIQGSFCAACSPGSKPISRPTSAPWARPRSTRSRGQPLPPACLAAAAAGPARDADRAAGCLPRPASADSAEREHAKITGPHGDFGRDLLAAHYATSH